MNQSSIDPLVHSANFSNLNSKAMNSESAGFLSHVSLGTNDLSRAAHFYDQVLETLSIRRIDIGEDQAIAYGKHSPEFWVVVPHNDKPATSGNGVHIGFKARSKLEVQAFHEAALSAGGIDAGAPGARPDYGESYYGCFVIDPDGNKVEACFWGLVI